MRAHGCGAFGLLVGWPRLRGSQPGWRHARGESARRYSGDVQDSVKEPGRSARSRQVCATGSTLRLPSADRSGTRTQTICAMAGCGPSHPVAPFSGPAHTVMVTEAAVSATSTPVTRSHGMPPTTASTTTVCVPGSADTSRQGICLSRLPGTGSDKVGVGMPAPGGSGKDRR